MRQRVYDRPRLKTEPFGLVLTLDEKAAVQRYLRERQLSATDYLREVAIAPIVELMRAKDGPDGQD